MKLLAFFLFPIFPINAQLNQVPIHVTDPECQPQVANVFYNAVLGSQTAPGYATCVADMANQKPNPDAGLSTPELIKRYGFPVEIHSVTTADGYILTVHRIPNPGKQPVYLQHGLGGSSDNWLMIAEKSLAFLLYNAGYDVWLGNYRGTTYSLGNTDPNKQWNSTDNILYWDWSFHELGKYDVPAVIKFIVDKTKRQIFYVGHSMGSTGMLVAFDQDPDFVNANVKKIVFLATSGFMGRCLSPFALLAPFSDDEYRHAIDVKLKGRIENPAQWLQLFNTSLAEICTPTAARCAACPFFIYAIFGFDAPQMNYTNVPNLVSRFPNTVSTKTMSHYGQSIWSCCFRQYDYGPEENQKRYERDEPPCYSLEEAKTPVYAFYGAMDNTNVPEDSERTFKLFPDGVVKMNQRVKWDFWTHVDHVIAKDVDKLVYRCLLKIFGTQSSEVTCDE